MNTVDKTTTQSLLGSLYDAVMAPNGFQDFIETFSTAFRLKAVTMVIRHIETQEVKGLWLCGITKEWLESYMLDYAREDILAQHIMNSPISLFYASNLDIPHPERFAETRFYREWVVPQGVAYAAGGIVLQEGAWLTQLILQRAPDHVPFTREEMDELNQLVPHLQRAIQMRQRFAELQFGQNFLVGGLDVLAMPTLLFDEYSRVGHHNRSAAALLADSGALWIENGHLRTRDLAVTRQLNLEIGNAIRLSRGDENELTGVVLLPRPGQMHLMLMIAPLKLANGSRSQGGGALVFAFDPETTPSMTTDLVRRLFGLSEAEAELAVTLCSGKTLDDAATERGTSIHTTRSQLKSIFNKTGTKRQTDLVSLLLSSPAYFLAQNQVK
jgi:DNA-binding CsgD family transcriptional regulator